MAAVDGLDALLGSRVALRHRIGERDGRPLFTDVVGELTEGGERDGVATVVVATRRGPVRVDKEAVVAVRAVPPAQPKRPSWSVVGRLEVLCADAWPAQADRPLGAWRLRAAGGFTGRANAALAAGDPGVPIPAALDAVRAFAAEHGITPRVQAPMGSPWSKAVAGEGWVLDAGHAAGAEVAVLVADLDRFAGADPAGVVLADRASDDWWEAALGDSPTPAQRHVLEPGPDGPSTAFGLARAGGSGDPAGVIRAAVVADHLHLSRLAVAPAARRTGVATALTAAAARWGREHGARWAVLQVAVHNTEALAFYDALGATEHHRYHYLVPPERNQV
ncbi:GNAT family N-acetyltransferase [Pseudonocardia bannensis]|uniref:GNAT family N-acetyltransferase n=1 Tax=Pseudonocardia bannensis TaxID=630973 RepID=A0A848DG10_9PSEU|nr:GNAT family N-acetyltransferase [Pseudonocardia bannensis]NMH91588.1 GNAT family N-acetyltransferase [Pseudonocardia bannensis]